MLVVLFAACLLISGCDAQEVRTRWADRPITVDGDDSDWAAIPTTYLKDSPVQLGLRNDNDNLYVLLSSVDPSWAMAIRFGNLTLWFDTTGETEEKRGLRFRGGVPPSEIFNKLFIGEERPGADFPEDPAMHENGEAPFGEFSIVNDKGETAIELDGSAGPSAGFGAPRASFAFEFSVPLGAVETSLFAVGAEPGQQVGIGIEWGDVDRDAIRDARDDVMESKPGVAEQQDGRLRGTRRGGSVMLPSQDKIWVITTLALPESR
jgi:hypothetical protein